MLRLAHHDGQMLGLPDDRRASWSMVTTSPCIAAHWCDLRQRIIRRELEDQCPGLDAGALLTSVSVIVHLHPSGAVRSVQFRTDRKRDVLERGGRHNRAREDAVPVTRRRERA